MNYQKLAAFLGGTFDYHTIVTHGELFELTYAVYQGQDLKPVLALSVALNEAQPVYNDFHQLIIDPELIETVSQKGFRINILLKEIRQKNAEEIYAEKIRSVLKTISFAGYRNCDESNGKAGPTSVYKVNGQLYLLSEEGVQNAESSMANARGQYNAVKEKVIPGALGALLGAALGAGVIVLFGRLNLISAFSGVVMGLASVYGYQKLAGRLSIKGLVIVMVCMVIMILIGHRLDWTISIHPQLTELGYDFTFMEVFELMGSFVKDGAIEASAYYGDLIMIFLFALLGWGPRLFALIKEEKERFSITKI